LTIRRKKLRNPKRENRLLEDYYKGSQRVVTKAVDLSKKTTVKAKDISKIPLEDRRLEEMTNAEYLEWEKKEPIKAKSWVARATNLSSSQALSRQKVYAKYPNWLAMQQGYVAPSKEYLEFHKVAEESPDKYINSPEGPEICMTDMEVSLKIVKPAKEPDKALAKPPVKKAPKSMAQGAAGKGASAASGKAKLTEEEFEALSSEEQDVVMENQVLSEK